jgi:adenylate cyclase
MAIEIERKFICSPLILAELFQPHVIFTAQKIVQGLITDEPMTRIRLTEQLVDTPKCEKGRKTAYLTVKGKPAGASRNEYEDQIGTSMATELLAFVCRQPLTVKTRFCLQDSYGKYWDVDIYHGENAGLIVGEIQLSSNDEKFQLPCWALREVTEDPEYSNTNLAQNRVSHA